jgi:hypothetical protein
MREGIILFFSFLIVFSKFFDCYTTHKGINRIGVHGEKNELVRGFMIRFGYVKTIWIVFLIVILIVSFVTVYLIKYSGIVETTAFVMFSIFISIAHFGLAINNHQGRRNWVTKRLEKIVNYINLLISGRR